MTDYEWISPDRQLPPTECPLVILVPAGTWFPYPDGPGTLRSDCDEVLLVQRKDHVESKGREMTYWLLDDDRQLTEMSLVGRYDWTYP